MHGTQAVGGLWDEEWNEDASGNANPTKPKEGVFCCWWHDNPPLWMMRTFDRFKDGKLRGPIYILFGCPARVLWTLNAIALVFHLGMTVYVSTLPIVRLPVYFTRIKFERSLEGSTSTWDLVPTYDTANRVHYDLTGLTMVFFGLSAAFHAFVVIISPWKSIYYWWIDKCRNPLRCADHSHPRSPPPPHSVYVRLRSGGSSTRCRRL